MCQKQVSKIILFAENELKEAENYFFKKAPLKVKKFAKPSQYEKIFLLKLMESCITAAEFYQQKE